ncbi:MAG: TolB family protein [Anaerolineales bacterium]
MRVRGFRFQPQKWLIWPLGLLGVVLLGLVLWLSAWRSQAPSSPYLVFSSNRASTIELYRMRPDGRHITRLTSTLYREEHPVLSSDGRRLAFVSNVHSVADVFVWDGFWHSRRNIESYADVQRLTATARVYTLPAWRPNSPWLSFVTNRDGDFALYQMHSTDGRFFRITPRDFAISDAVWSPNGDALALIGGADEQLYRQDIGGERIALTPPDVRVRGASWSPDGQWIVYSGTGPEVRLTNSLYRIPAAGGEAQRVVDVVNVSGRPAWSPDGEWIAFTMTDTLSGDQNIYMVRPTGHDLRALTSQPSIDRYPAWAPIVDFPWFGLSMLRLGLLGGLLAGLGLWRLCYNPT